METTHKKLDGFKLRQQAVQRLAEHYRTNFSQEDKDGETIDGLVNYLNRSRELEREFKSIRFFFDKENNRVIEPTAFTKEGFFVDTDVLFANSISLYDLRWHPTEKLPRTPCVCFAFDFNLDVYYIGFSKNLCGAWGSHRLKKYNDQIQEEARLNPKDYLVPNIRLIFLFVNEEDGRDWVRLYKQFMPVYGKLPMGRIGQEGGATNSPQS